MCGISGAIGFINPQIQDAVKAMNRSMHHRGPDMQGFWSNVDYSSTSSSGLVIAHNRLSIIDLSESGSQPMHDESGNVIVYNGEFYNYNEIKTKFFDSDTSFKSTSDTEVLLKLLSKYDTDALDHVNGMFAFAFWNKHSETLTLARDRMGIKPLYYVHIKHGSGESTLLFASEIRALLSTNLIARKIEPKALETFLWNGYVSGEYSIIKDIKLLGAGQTLKVDSRGAIKSVDQYWELNNSSKSGTYDSCKQALFDAVDRRLVSDVPLGVFLSGGIDSSAIASITSQIRDSDVHTFNVGFPEEEYDESKYAIEVAKHLKTNHTTIKLMESDFASYLPDAMNSIDQPTFDAINTYFVSKAVKEAGITVALSGAGGDELFGGYTSFKDVPKMLKVARFNRVLPDKLLKLLQSTINHAKYGSSHSVNPQVRWGKLYDSFNTNGDLLKAFQVSYALFTKETLNEIQPSLNYENYGLTDQYTSQLRSHLKGDNVLEDISYLELMTFITQRLLRDTDTSSMAVSLEVRVPFMDHQFVEKVSGLDSHRRYQPLGSKAFIRDAALSNLPRQIFERPKSGFVLPFDKWIKNTLQDRVVETFNDQSVCSDLGINQDFILRLLSAYQTGTKGIYWSRIWSLYVLLNWCNKHRVTL